ncbi:LPXTG cell wall anchor domain-containing protein [Parasphingorhabdus sp.]
MQLDGYAGWIGLAVVILGVAGGLWGRKRKK